MQSYAAILEARATSPAASGKSVANPNPHKLDNVAACGSVHCAGCYEVEPGVLMHPPKSSEEWKGWLLKWEPKGPVQ